MSVNTQFYGFSRSLYVSGHNHLHKKSDQKHKTRSVGQISEIKILLKLTLVYIKLIR